MSDSVFHPEHLYDPPDETAYLAAMQHLVDTGTAWRLEGAVGREAMALLEAGRLMLGPVGHHDYWGNYVPSRHEVEPGTVGSPEYVADEREPT
jgi:hypothetical protein